MFSTCDCHIIVYFLASTGIDDGDIRLIDAMGDTDTSTQAGRVEVFHNGLWGTICNIDFDIYEGDIICRQLGFLYVDVVGVVGELG